MSLQVKSSADIFKLRTKQSLNTYDIVYLGTYPEDNCSDHYIGESRHQISERIIDHNSRDKKSHIFKHSSEKCHNDFHTNSFKVIGNGFKNNSFKRKVSEALQIKQIKS